MVFIRHFPILKTFLREKHPIYKSIRFVNSGSGIKKRSRFSNGPSLEEFMFRKRLKTIYRDVLRLIYKNHEKDGLLQYVQGEFRVGVEKDLNYRRYLLNQGINKINEMVTMMGIRSKKFDN